MGVKTDQDTILTFGVGETEVMPFSFPNLGTGETISSVTDVTISPSGEMSDSSSAVLGSTVEVTVSGGVAGTYYAVVITIQTSAARVLKAGGVCYWDDA